MGEDSKKRKDALVQKGLAEGLTLNEGKELIFLEKTNQLSDEYLDKYRHDPNSLTSDEKDVLNRALSAFIQENLKYYDTDTVQKMVDSLFAEGATFKDYDFPYAASSELKNKITDYNKAGLGFWDSLTYTRDIPLEEWLYKDALNNLAIMNEHKYWAQIGDPVLNFLLGAPGFVVNVKDAMIVGSQMGQATASFLNDGFNASSVGLFTEGALNAGGAIAGSHWGYKDGVTPSASYPSVWQEKIVVKPASPKAGAGGNWNELDEIVDPNVVKQSTPTGCGGACGEMLLKDRNIFVDQTQIGTGLKNPEQLARDLTKNSGSSWSGDLLVLKPMMP